MVLFPLVLGFIVNKDLDSQCLYPQTNKLWRETERRDLPIFISLVVENNKINQLLMNSGNTLILFV